MNGRARRNVFLVGAIGLGALLLWGDLGLPPSGQYPGPYGLVLDAVAVQERHATNLASAVNFDYRALDTLGEEYILFAAVAGVSMLLRHVKGEHVEEPNWLEEQRHTTDAVRWFGTGLIGASVLFGIYVVCHGHLSPGGGFQGGAILGTACLLVYLADEYRTFRGVSPRPLIELAEATGAGGYILVGLAGVLAGAAFLENIFPLGNTGEMLSAGTIPVINLAVGLEVAAGFVLLFIEFLAETLKITDREG